MAVIAVLRIKWRKDTFWWHVLVAMTNLVPLAFSTTPHLLDIVHGRSDESKGHSAKCASLRDLHLEIRWLATIKPSQVFPLQIWINYNYHGPVEYDVDCTSHQYCAHMGPISTFQGAYSHAYYSKASFRSSMAFLGKSLNKIITHSCNWGHRCLLAELLYYLIFMMSLFKLTRE